MADIANTFAVIATEVCDGLEVRGEATDQPHQFNIALAFSLQPTAGQDTVEVSVEVQLQQH
jgi:hypothetical protein